MQTTAANYTRNCCWVATPLPPPSPSPSPSCGIKYCEWMGTHGNKWLCQIFHIFSFTTKLKRIPLNKMKVTHGRSYYDRISFCLNCFVWSHNSIITILFDIIFENLMSSLVTFGISNIYFLILILIFTTKSIIQKYTYFSIFFFTFQILYIGHSFD